MKQITQVDISTIAEAVLALDYERMAVEQEQIELAEQMYQMIRRQAVLSAKCKALKNTVKELLK